MCASPLAIAAAPTAASTSFDAQANAILARAKAASGGAAWDSVRAVHYACDYTQNGIPGRLDAWQDLLTGRSAFRAVIGSHYAEGGYDGKKYWRQNVTDANRVFDDPDDRTASCNDAYIAARAYWYPERFPAKIVSFGSETKNDNSGRLTESIDTVTVQPTGGTPLTLVFDHATGLLTRVDYGGSDSPQKQSTTYSDYKPAPGGILAPYTIQDSVGDAAPYTVLHLTELDVNAPVPPHVFEAPTAPIDDYSFAGDASSVTVPLHFSNDLLFLPIKINGRPFNAIFDTGAQFLIDSSLAKSQGGTPIGATPINAFGDQPVTAGDVEVQSVQIGGLTLHHPEFASSSVPVEIQPYPLVGYELLQRFVVTLNFDRRTITFTRPDRYHAPSAGTVVPFRFAANVAAVDGSLDGLPGLFTIDSGSADSLIVMTPFATANNLGDKYKTSIAVPTGFGLGGMIDGSVVRTKTLTLGGVAVHDCLATLSTNKAGYGTIAGVAGNVGSRILSQFNVVFDFPHRRLIFTPNKLYGHPDHYSTTGLIADDRAGKLVVVGIVPGSPADKAGIKVGDVIVAANNKRYKPVKEPPLYSPADEYRPGDYDGDLPPGTRVSLTILPGGTGRPLTVMLVARSLI